MAENDPNFKVLIYRNPVLTLQLFFRGIFRYGCGLKQYLSQIVIFALIFSAISVIPELTSIRLFLYTSIYWLILGVASSIGLGTGLHTGLLFLFPHIIQTSLKNGPDHVMLTIGQLYLPTILWGIGTALGEIPPYYMARVNRLNKTSEPNLNIPGTQTFMYYIQKYNFWAILFFASYPNALFDMCGIASGYYLISFSTFISATIIGKAFIKAHYQMILMVFAVFPDKYLTFLPQSIYEKILGFVSSITNPSLEIDHINQGMTTLDMISNLWSAIVYCFLAYFIVGTIEAVAQSEYDKDI